MTWIFSFVSALAGTTSFARPKVEQLHLLATPTTSLSAPRTQMNNVATMCNFVTIVFMIPSIYWYVSLNTRSL